MGGWEHRHKIVPAVYIWLERENKTLFIRRANTGYQDGSYTWPTGHLEGNEPPSVAAAREVHEEVGVTVDPKDLQLVHCMVYKALEGDHERVSLFFKASNFSGEPHNAEPHKSDELRWFAADELPTNIVWELQHALGQIEQGVLYSEANY